MQRHSRLLGLTIGVVLAAIGACSDASRLAAPDNAALTANGSANFSRGGGDDHNGDDRSVRSQSGDDHDWNDADDPNDEHDKSKDKWRSEHDNDKVTICHAAGRAGTSKYVEITVSRHASYAHIDEHGTPRAGHEEDYYEDSDDHGCTSQAGVTKTLTSVMTTVNGQMVNDPTWSAGQPVVIPKGETRWLFYTINYSMPSGAEGTLSENRDVVCGTLGSGYHCSFNTQGKFSWTVKGTGTKVIQIDLTNNSDCSDHNFTNTITLTPKKGTTETASATTVVRGSCGATLTKVLDHVMTEVLDASGNQVGMINDPAYTGGAVTIPVGQTRWLFYRVDYNLPAGVTGTLVDNSNTACATLGGGNLTCHFANPGAVNGVYSWSVSGSGSMMVQVDISDNGYNGVCGDRTFTNTAVLTTSTGQTVTASSTKTIHFDCNLRLSKVLDHVMTEVLDASGNQVGMAPDPNFTGGAVTIPAGQTRWLFYRIDYSAPPGTTVTLTDDGNLACATLGGGNLQCHFANPGAVNGVYSWQVSGTGSMMVQVDISDNGYASVCGDRTFTNTAKLTVAGVPALSASAPTLIHFTCP